MKCLIKSFIRLSVLAQLMILPLANADIYTLLRGETFQKKIKVQNPILLQVNHEMKFTDIVFQEADTNEIEIEAKLEKSDFRKQVSFEVVHDPKTRVLYLNVMQPSKFDYSDIDPNFSISKKGASYGVTGCSNLSLLNVTKRISNELSLEASDIRVQQGKVVAGDFPNSIVYLTIRGPKKIIETIEVRTKE